MGQTLFPGGYFKEFIFFHKESKSLFLTDTIINIELDKIGEPWRTATRLTGMYHPHGQIFWYAPAVLSPAAEGKGSGDQNPLVATSTHLVESRRCRC
jgi:hypothetical protein